MLGDDYRVAARFDAGIAYAPVHEGLAPVNENFLGQLALWVALALQLAVLPFEGADAFRITLTFGQASSSDAVKRE